MNENINYKISGIGASHTKSKGFEMKRQHMHEAYEIYLSFSNNLHCYVNSKIYEINKNDILLFNRSDLHRISVSNNTDYERIVITFSQNDIKTFYDENPMLLDCFNKRTTFYSNKNTVNKEQVEKITILAHNIIETKDADYFSNLKKQINIISILLIINPIYNSNSSNTKENIQDYRVKKICHYIDNHFNENINLDDISKACYLSKYYMCHYFKNKMGYTVISYIQYHRIAHANKLLIDGFTINETSSLCGFNSTTYFISTYKKHMGITPHQFILKNK